MALKTETHRGRHHINGYIHKWNGILLTLWQSEETSVAGRMCWKVIIRFPFHIWTKGYLQRATQCKGSASNAEETRATNEDKSRKFKGTGLRNTNTVCGLLCKGNTCRIGNSAKWCSASKMSNVFLLQNWLLRQKVPLQLFCAKFTYGKIASALIFHASVSGSNQMREPQSLCCRNGYLASPGVEERKVARHDADHITF